MRSTAAALAWICHSLMAGSTGHADERPKHVPLLSVALDCAEFHDQAVVVTGAVRVKFEEQTICPTREFLDGDSLHCLWLRVDEVMDLAALAALESRTAEAPYMMVEGTVSCEHRGHLSMWGGSLRSITLIVDEALSEIVWTSKATP